MRVALLKVVVPFVAGGTEFLVANLRRALVAAGHEVEELALPDHGYGQREDLVDAIMAARLLRFATSGVGRIDRLITFKFPAYHVPFERKSVWLLHPWRQAYELWHHSGMARSSKSWQLRNLVLDADRVALREAEVVHALSRTVASRMKQFLALDTPPLYCPPPTQELLRCESSEGYLYYPSRLTPLKRFELVLAALAQTRYPVRLVVSGREDQEGYADSLVAQAERLGVAERVSWRGQVSDEERAALFARCHAVVFPPLHEDYGFVTPEAMLSGKAVVTTSDAGGPTEFVRHEVTGLVAEPTPEGLAAALDRLWADPSLARELGAEGQRAYGDHNISWDAVAAALTHSPKVD